MEEAGVGGEVDDAEEDNEEDEGEGDADGGKMRRKTRVTTGGWWLSVIPV